MLIQIQSWWIYEFKNQSLKEKISSPSVYKEQLNFFSLMVKFMLKQVWNCMPKGRFFHQICNIKKILHKTSKLLYVMDSFSEKKNNSCKKKKQLLQLQTFYGLVYVKPYCFWRFRITSHIILASQISFISASIMNQIFFKSKSLSCLWNSHSSFTSSTHFKSKTKKTEKVNYFARLL